MVYPIENNGDQKNVVNHGKPNRKQWGSMLNWSWGMIPAPLSRQSLISASGVSGDVYGTQVLHGVRRQENITPRHGSTWHTTSTSDFSRYLRWLLTSDSMEQISHAWFTTRQGAQKDRTVHIRQSQHKKNDNFQLPPETTSKSNSFPLFWHFNIQHLQKIWCL